MTGLRNPCKNRNVQIIPIYSIERGRIAHHARHDAIGGHLEHARCLAAQIENRIEFEVFQQVAPSDAGRENPGLDAPATTE
jgi:hypothetical protein